MLPMQTTDNSPKLFGIPNCSTVQKTMAWLTEQGHTPQFHDFKKHGVDASTLARWLRQHDWQVLLNRRGTTWRQLEASAQASVQDAASAAQLMCTKPSLIKRPVIEWPSGTVTVGFDPETLEQAMAGGAK